MVKAFTFVEIPTSSQGESRKPTYFVDKTGCSQHTIFPGVDIFTTAGKHVLMSLVEFQPGAIGGSLSSARADGNGPGRPGAIHRWVVEKVLGPGDMCVIPGGTVHKVIALDCLVKALDFFHPVREEYL